MNLLQLIAFIVASASWVSAQETRPVFEVADVHPSARSANPVNPAIRGGFIRSGGYEVRGATMVDLIGAAWGIDAEKVTGGPSWLDRNRFDVIAKGPADATPESIRQMLQSLLVDRFKLVVHRDMKPFPEYALMAGKKPQLKEAAGGGESGCQALPQNAQSAAPGAIQIVTVSCRNTTMAEFANRLPRMAGNYFQLTSVVDLTGLKGSWDFVVKFTGRRSLAMAGADGVSIFDAVDKQLGLKLVVQNVPVPVIAVDGVSEKPTENPPGVSQNLPAIATAFEVAVIKPSAPESTQTIFRIEPGGRVELRGFTLKHLIKYAWDFQDNDVRDNDDMLAGAPKWSETERFDIEAKAPDPAIDIDTVHAMLRALVTDRFRLTTHTEDRPVSVYALVAAKPKLKKADPSNRPGCRNAPAPAGSMPIFSLACRNMTMAQLAEQLQPIGGSYIPHPVIDATGLGGAWDFTLNWSPPHLLQGGVEAGVPADPNGGLTLVEALDKQLGLKLKLEKHTMPVLVIDRMEQKPTDN